MLYHISLYTANQWLLYDSTVVNRSGQRMRRRYTSRVSPKKNTLALCHKRLSHLRQVPTQPHSSRNTPTATFVPYVVLRKHPRGTGCVLAHKQEVTETPEISTLALVITLPTEHNKDHTTVHQKMSMSHRVLIQEKYFPLSQVTTLFNALHRASLPLGGATQLCPRIRTTQNMT